MKRRIHHAEIARAYAELFVALRERPYSRENDALELAARNVFRALDELVALAGHPEGEKDMIEVEVPEEGPGAHWIF